MAERLGIRVFCRHLPSRIFAASELWHRIVVLNRRRSPLQQRYDLAHEIAEQITLDMGNSHGAWQNQFAGHLLVPLDCLRGQILKGADLDRLCQRFDTSESVVFYQMAFLKDGILLSQADENIRGSVVRSDQAAIGSGGRWFKSSRPDIDKTGS